MKRGQAAAARGAQTARGAAVASRKAHQGGRATHNHQLHSQAVQQQDVCRKWEEYSKRGAVCLPDDERIRNQQQPAPSHEQPKSMQNPQPNPTASTCHHRPAPSSGDTAAPCAPPPLRVSPSQRFSTPGTNHRHLGITPTFQQGVQPFLAPHHLSRDHHYERAAAVARNIGRCHVQEAHKQAAKKGRAC